MYLRGPNFADLSLNITDYSKQTVQRIIWYRVKRLTTYNTDRVRIMILYT